MMYSNGYVDSASFYTGDSADAFSAFSDGYDSVSSVFCSLADSGNFFYARSRQTTSSERSTFARLVSLSHEGTP